MAGMNRGSEIQRLLRCQVQNAFTSLETEILEVCAKDRRGVGDVSAAYIYIYIHTHTYAYIQKLIVIMHGTEFGFHCDSQPGELKKLYY